MGDKLAIWMATKLTDTMKVNGFLESELEAHLEPIVIYPMDFERSGHLTDDVRNSFFSIQVSNIMFRSCIKSW